MRFLSWPMLGYILAVLAVNVGFSIIHPVMTPLGLFAPMALLVGAIFIIRDYAQRASGHFVLVGMLIGTVLSFILADPRVALASAAAFAVSELVDWGVYTFSKKPFHERVVLSSLIAVPIDTAVFLFGIGAMSTGTFLIMVASKLVAVGIIVYLARREIREPAWDV